MKNNNDLFYTCSLIEYIGRERKLKRSEVVKLLGKRLLPASMITRMCSTASRLQRRQMNYYGLPDSHREL